MLHRRVSITFLFVVSMVFTANRSQAQFPYPYGWQGWGAFPPVGYFYGQNINVPTPPYFAIHPPVFYGQRMYRPYGMSPFAAWPSTEHDLWKARSSRKPVVIVNSHVPSTPAESIPTPDEVTDSETPRPITVHNPFVMTERTVATQTSTDGFAR